MLIPVFGIDGAGMATAISIVFFNFVRLIIIYNKMNIQPFSYKTIFTILILFFVYFVCYKVNLDNVFLNILIKTILSISIFAIICFKSNLSDDINKLVNDLVFRFLKK